MGNHSTRSRRAEIRAYMEEHGVNYTTAQRAVADTRQQRRSELRGSDGSPALPRILDEFWVPDYQSYAPGAVDFDVCRAASVPWGRPRSLADRFRQPGTYEWEGTYRLHKPWSDQDWFLPLLYSMLMVQQPELVSNEVRAGLRHAIERHETVRQVDLLLDPLDRAAARLLAEPASTWWETTKPRLDEFVTWARTAPWMDRRSPEWNPMVNRAQIESANLAEKWDHAWEQYFDGERWTYRGVMWQPVQANLNGVLARRYSGYAPGDQVLLVDGRAATVHGAEWGDDGPPLAYFVRENVVPWPLDEERVEPADVVGAAAV